MGKDLPTCQMTTCGPCTPVTYRWKCAKAQREEINCPRSHSKERVEQKLLGNLMRKFCLPGQEAQGQIEHHELENLPKVQNSLSGFWKSRRTLWAQASATGTTPG